MHTQQEHAIILHLRCLRLAITQFIDSDDPRFLALLMLNNTSKRGPRPRSTAAASVCYHNVCWYIMATSTTGHPLWMLHWNISRIKRQLVSV